MEIKRFVLPEIKLENSAYHFVDLENASDAENKEIPINEENIETKINIPSVDYAELENIKLHQYKQGYSEGYKKAQEEFNNNNQTQLNAMISNINVMIASLSSEVDKKIDEIIPELVNLSKIIAEKIAGCEINLNYKEQIKKSTQEIISTLSKNVSIILTVNPTNVQLIEEIISDNNNSNIRLLQSNQISLYDCKIEWSNGILLYNLKDRMLEIDNIIRENLADQIFINSEENL